MIYYKSYDQILEQYVSKNILLEIDEYMGIRSQRCVIWSNFEGDRHRNNVPALITQCNNIITQKLWCRHGIVYRNGNLAYHVGYYDSGEIAYEFWMHNETVSNTQLIPNMPCSAWYNKYGHIDVQNLCDLEHAHENN